MAVGGMALQQQRCEQLDQMLSAEDTVLLEQEDVLEPAIPQPSSIGGETGAVVRVGEEVELCTYTHRFYDIRKMLNIFMITDYVKKFKMCHTAIFYILDIYCNLILRTVKRLLASPF